MEITTARILDKRRMLKKTKSYRLAIRVTFDRKPMAFPVHLHLTEDEFNKLSSTRVSKELSKIREKFIEEEQRAKEIIRSMGTFTFQAFREEFYKEKFIAKRQKMLQRTAKFKVNSAGNRVAASPLANSSEGRNRKYGRKQFDRIRSNINFAELGPVAIGYGEYIKLLEAQERIGTSENYFSSLLSFLKFKPHLRFEDVTVKFLYEYEQWMLAKGNSYTAIGIYTRNMRAIFNNQIADGLLHPRYYPFGKRKYQIPTGANVKKALELSDLKKLYDYEPDPENKNEGFARDMWFFGYYSNGINPRDIAHLKYKNIDDGFIQLRREKTKFTTRATPKTIIIPINEDMQVIIDRWGNTDKDPENYIFPVLIDNMSAHRRYELVQGFLAIINDWMKVITKKVGIKKRVTTMTWRHTYATVLKRSGISSEFIKEALGHTDLKTTENYLDSFELEIKKKYSHNLTAFKEIKEELIAES